MGKDFTQEVNRMKKILILVAASTTLGGCMAMVTPDGNVQTALLVPPVETVAVYPYQPVPPAPVWIVHRPYIRHVTPRVHRVVLPPRHAAMRPTPLKPGHRALAQYKPTRPRMEQPRHKPGVSGRRTEPKKHK